MVPRGIRPAAALVAVVAIAAGVAFVTALAAPAALGTLVVGALALGVLLVLPIGGADMPVVISLLNACTGTAVAMAGFVLRDPVLITAGALVGASGSILTVLMAAAMNRSLLDIVTGGFGGGGSGASGPGDGQQSAAGVRVGTAEDVAVLLAYAHRVIVVPGFGLAAARAQQALVDLDHTLTDAGVEVRYAVHPVAAGCPGT